jgi:ubiquinone/menaquinone biosynthesis C-methylase UbiE
VVAHLRRSGKRAEGITYQRSEVDAAKAKHGIDLVFGDLHALPWADSSFDGAICWDALEHTLAPLIALRELRRVLAPRGRALIFIPGQPWQQERYHIIVPTIAQMCHLLGLAGFHEWEVVDYSQYVTAFGKQDQMAVYRVTQ